MRADLVEALERDAASPYDMTDMQGRAERAGQAALALRALRDAPVGKVFNVDAWTEPSGDRTILDIDVAGPCGIKDEQRVRLVVVGEEG